MKSVFYPRFLESGVEIKVLAHQTLEEAYCLMGLIKQLPKIHSEQGEIRASNESPSYITNARIALFDG